MKNKWVLFINDVPELDKTEILQGNVTVKCV